MLQHPQEDDVVLGTAPILAQALASTRVAVGLSWPSLEALVGREVDRSRWAVLYASPRPAELPPELASRRALVLDRHEALRGPGEPPLEGMLVLDGTWSQAKTLWWRNAWLLKLGRISLEPREPSMYGKLRKEPRREWVSTLEAVADVVAALDPDATRGEATRGELRRAMRTMLQRVRDALGEG